MKKFKVISCILIVFALMELLSLTDEGIKASPLDSQEILQTLNSATPSNMKGGTSRTTYNSVWVKQQTGWKYAKSNGRYAKAEWLRVNGKWYWFWYNETMATGWIDWQGNWYYLSEEDGLNEGIMQTGWLYDTSYEGWFYLDSSGKLVKGWQLINGQQYYFNMREDGIEGKLAVDSDIEYYLNPSGILEMINK